MAKIPEQKDPTLMAMMKAIENVQDKTMRNYLGASSIGRECARELWYGYNGNTPNHFDAYSLMNFEDGHRTEDLTAERLRLVDGIELWTHDKNGKQFGFSDFDGQFRGHYDGIIKGLLQAPKKLHVWECKASGQKKFDEFVKIKQRLGEKMTLKEWNFVYYIQAQIYMHYTNIDRHYLTVSLAGGRDYDSCRTEYVPEVAEQYRARAEKIIKAKEPPPRINEKPDFYICRFCNYKDICRNEAIKTIPRSRTNFHF